MTDRKILVTASILFVIAVIFHFYSKRFPGDEETKNVLDFFKRPMQWQGKYAPDFELELLSAEKFTLSDQVGKKVIILNFFATWCGPCKEEMPELIRFYEKHREEPFILLGINASEDEKKVKEFVEKFKINFPVAIDKGNKIQKMYSVRSYPTTILIGADGTVSLYEIGQIMNTDISFDTFYKIGLDVIQAGKGIEKETYLQNLVQQKNPEPEKEEAKDDKYKLEGRAKEIAQKMYCPCGCSHLLTDCNCKTGKDVKEKLKTIDLSKKTDQEIIRDLNKEFCTGNEE